MKTAKQSIMAIARNTYNQRKGTTTMNMMKKSIMAMALGVLALNSTPALAGDDYVVIKSGSLNFVDPGKGGVEKQRVTFTLPSNVDTKKAAILQLREKGVEFDFNAIYINPPSPLGDDNSFGCADKDSAPDVINQAALVASLDAHATTANTEVFTYHQVISGTNLKSGQNTFVICARGSDGKLDTTASSGDDAVNNDNFTASNIVLHYQTTP